MEPATPVSLVAPRSAAARAVQAIERTADRIFGQAANPLRQLGALAMLMLWIAFASGSYLYVVFDASAAGAHASIASLADAQPGSGALVRSLHRYSADAFALLTITHVLREWSLGRYAGFRWYSWISGLPLPWLALGSGLVGYWLAADARAAYVAAGIAEWTAWLPGFGDMPMRSLIAAEAPSDRLVSLLVFVHIGLALLILGALWIHLRRIARASTWPQVQPALAATAALIALSIAWPALSSAPASAMRLPATVAVDWFYFGVLPLMHSSSPAALWALAGGATLLLAVLPWTARATRPAAATVQLDRCNGCGRCFDDCPFGAVVMVPRDDGRRYALQARVEPDLCAGCGICVGACPSATPLRSKQDLVAGIELPGRPLAALRDRLGAALAQQPGALVVFGCDEGADVAALGAPRTVALSLPCSAMLPPSFVEFALRAGAGRVIVAGCGARGCTYRLGGRWTVDRLSGRRAPRLRKGAAQVPVVDALRGADAALREEIEQARGVLRRRQRPSRRGAFDG